MSVESRKRGAESKPKYRAKSPIGRIRFTRKEIPGFVTATALSLAGLVANDLWIVGPALCIAWVAFVYLCIVHKGGLWGRVISVVVITALLVLFACRVYWLSNHAPHWTTTEETRQIMRDELSRYNKKQEPELLRTYPEGYTFVGILNTGEMVPNDEKPKIPLQIRWNKAPFVVTKDRVKFKTPEIFTAGGGFIGNDTLELPRVTGASISVAFDPMYRGLASSNEWSGGDGRAGPVMTYGANPTLVLRVTILVADEKFVIMQFGLQPYLRPTQ